MVKSIENPDFKSYAQFFEVSNLLICTKEAAYAWVSCHILKASP